MEESDQTIGKVYALIYSFDISYSIYFFYLEVKILLLIYSIICDQFCWLDICLAHKYFDSCKCLNVCLHAHIAN